MRSLATIAGTLIVLAGLGVWLRSAATSGTDTGLVKSTDSTLSDARSSLPPPSGPPRGPVASGPGTHPAAARTELAAEATPALQRFLVHVVTATSFGRDGERVGAIAFRLYPQRVAQPGDLSGRLAPLPLAPDDTPLLEGRTDANGEARVELVLPGFPDGTFPLLCARVVEPGYQQQVALGRGAREEGDVRAIQILAQRGATARGRVVDAAGRGTHAEVHLRRWGMRDDVRMLHRAGAARALADGWFELHLERALEDAVLIADHANGTASLAGVALTLASPPQDLRLVLRGEGVLRGRLVDRSGAPAAGVEMFVVLAELDDERGSAVLPEPEHSLRELEGLGRTWASLVSAHDGSFHVGGLRAGAYVLRARIGQRFPEGYPQLLTPAPVLADGAELFLVVSRPHVVVRLRDAEGQVLVPGHPNRALYPSSSRQPSRWPEEPLVRVFESAPGPDGAPVAGVPVRGSMLPTGECLFELGAGARCFVSVQGGGFDGAPHEVEIPPGQDRMELELRARELGALGTVAVRVFHEGVELSGRAAHFSVRLEHRMGRVPVLRLGNLDNPSPYELRAPPGAYRVVVEGESWTDSQHGTLMGARMLGRSEAEVELRPGLTQELALEIDAGARLEVRLEGEPDATDAAALEHTPWLDEAQRRASAAKASLFLHHPGRTPEPVCFEEGLGEGPPFVQRLDCAWPLGTTQLSARLPTGRYTLVGRLHGGREARAEVELRAGATTAVTLRF